jgi:hypothetical protein
MPFAVFRRHSKKLLAIFAILSMIGFVLSDSLPALLRAGNESRRSDVVVAELYGKEVRRGDLAQLSTERSLANAFMANLVLRLYGRPSAQIFGETDLRSLIDGYILQHEANELGMPHGPDLAREWLSKLTNGQMDASLFELVLEPFRNQSQVTGEQMLSALASQIRLRNVRYLPGQPEVTPLDVYQAYRDRNERVSVNAVRIPVADFTPQVREPSTSKIQAYYERYKDVPANPSRETPGFKIPRQVRVQFVSADVEALARQYREKLAERELLDYFETRKQDFQLPPLESLPTTLFEDDPKNAQTPPPANPNNVSPELLPDPSPRYQEFADVRSRLEVDLSHDQAREEVDRMFTGVRDAMYKFSDLYNEVLDEVKDPNSQAASQKPLPQPPDLKPIAAAAGLTLETSPSLSRDAASSYGQIASAHVGQARFGEGRTFVDEMFAPGATLFEPIEMMNDTGRAFLTWKIADNPPRVPPLSEIQPEVVYYWKLEQARPLAQKAADELAAKVREAGGKFTVENLGSRTSILTTPVAKLEASMLPMPGQFLPPKPRPTEIPEIAEAGDDLRTALFDLEPGDVAVATDLPKANYYVMVLNKRYPVNYAMLYSPTGPLAMLKMEVLEDANDRLLDSWMNQLRTKAGLKPDWTPPEEDETRRPRRGD